MTSEGKGIVERMRRRRQRRKDLDTVVRIVFFPVFLAYDILSIIVLLIGFAFASFIASLFN